MLTNDQAIQRAYAENEKSLRRMGAFRSLLRPDSASVKLPVFTPNQYAEEFLLASRKNQNVDTLLQMAKRVDDPELLRLAKKVTTVEQEAATLRYAVTPLDEYELSRQLQALTPKEKERATSIFSSAIGRIRRETTYMSGLESSGIAPALEKADLFGDHYSSFVFILRARDFLGEGGRFFPHANGIEIKLHLDKRILKDTVVQCWPELVSSGFLHRSVEYLSHELHHAGGHKGTLLHRVCDLVPRLHFIPYVHRLHVSSGVSEGFAYLHGSLAPHIEEENNLPQLYLNLMRRYRLGDRCPFQLLETVQRLCLLGVTREESMAIERQSRFKSTDDVLKLLHREEATRREALGLTREENYPMHLALQGALMNVEGEVQRLKARTIAIEAAQSLGGGVFVKAAA